MTRKDKISHYELSYSAAISSCSFNIAKALNLENGMTPNFNLREFRKEILNWQKELYCRIVDGSEVIDLYSDYLFKHYDKYIDDFLNRNIENYLKRYLSYIKLKFENAIHVIPNHFNYDMLQTIDLIARRNVYAEMYDFLGSVKLRSNNDTFDILTKFKEFRDNKGSKDEVKIVLNEKIKWEGTQKELAELFIELKSKGWIEEVNPTKIMNAFTQSDSIQQVLKPGKNPRTNIDEYDQIYTKRYKPKFKGIEQNLTKLKNK